MRYIKSKESFLEFAKNKNLTPVKIDEAFQNEITWGGSLIGRLINSGIRKAFIMRNAKRLDSLGNEFEEYMNQLLQQAFSPEDIYATQRFYIYYILTLIYRAVMSGSTISIRLQVLLTKQQYQRSGSGPVNNSLNIRFANAYKIFEADMDREKVEDSGEFKKKDSDTLKDGLIELALSEIRQSRLDDKGDLEKKLEKFRDELLKIDFEKDKSIDDKAVENFIDTLTEPEADKKDKKDGDKEDEKKEASPETKTKFQFYNETKNFISAYLSILSNIKSSTVKIDTEKNVGDIVAWKQVKGADAGLVQFAQVTKVHPNSVMVRKLIYGKPTGPEFSLELKHLKSLTYFDDTKYKKMREDTVDQIKQKAAQARLAKYTYQNLKKTSLDDHYTKEVERLNAELKSKTEKKEESVGNTNWNMFDMLFESEVIIPKIDYASIDTWSEIVDVFKKMKESNEELFKSHVNYLQGLLQNKVEGKDNPTQAKSDITEIGRLVLKRIKAKDAKMLERQMNVSEKKVFDAATIVSQIALALLKLKGKDIAALKNDSKGGVGTFVEKYLKAFDGMVEAWKKGAVKIMETSLLTNYDQFRIILEEDVKSDRLALARADAAKRDAGDEDNSEESDAKEDNDTDTSNTSDQEAKETDGIRIAWFKYFSKGEEKKWAYDPEEVANYETRIEKGPMDMYVNKGQKNTNESFILLEKENIDSPKEDPIMKIIDIFGRAYNLYATDYIPSGRPGGRVSQKTLREYQFIGSGKSEARADASREGDYYTPSRGPWANTKVFEKWKSLVNKVIQNPVYRTVLANINFVSDAEKIASKSGRDTQQEYGKVADSEFNRVSKGSGISLMEFINKMISLQGEFKDAANALTRKYFNIEWIEKNDYPGNKPRSDKEADKDDEKPYFTPNGSDKLKEGAFYVFKVSYKKGGTDTTKYWVVWVWQFGGGNSNKKRVIRVHESDDINTIREAFIASFFNENDMDLVRSGAMPTTPRVGKDSNKEVFLIVTKSDISFDARTYGGNDILKINWDVNGQKWDINSHETLKLKNVSIKNILCTNEKDGKRVPDTPVIKNWEATKKAANDHEITSLDLNAIDALRIT